RHVVARDEQIVDISTQDAADARPDDRDPPPRVAGAEHVHAPAREGGEQSRSEIACRIDRVSGIEPEGRTDQQDQCADDNWREGPGRRGIALIGNGEDAADQQRRADDLIDQSTWERAEERLRIRGEDAGRAFGAYYLADAVVEVRERLVIRH